MVRDPEWYAYEIENDPKYYEKLKSLIGKTLETFGQGADHYGVSDPSLDDDLDIPIEHVDQHLP